MTLLFTVPNVEGGSNFNGGPEGYGYGVYYKALFIHYGTLKLDANISIPSLTEGGQDFNVIPTAGLWINGANVSTTLSRGEWYRLSGGNAVWFITHQRRTIFNRRCGGNGVGNVGNTGY